MNKPLSIDLEPNKYFSLPRPKYNPKPEVVQAKMRTLSAVDENRARGGRRFTVDVSSNDVATALADIGIKRAAVMSRSNTHLNAIYEDEMRISTLPNMKLKKELPKGDVAHEKRELSGPEFIENSSTQAKVLDITDNKVRNLSQAIKFNLIKANLTFHIIVSHSA